MFDLVRRKLVRLDAFPKFVREARDQTSTGAVISLVTIGLIFLLTLYEISWYRQTDVEKALEVDYLRSETMRINFDIVFPRIPCSMVAMDAHDVTGQQQKHLMHNVFKKRLDQDGRPLGMVERNELGNTLRSEDELRESKLKAMEEGRPDLTLEKAKKTGQECGSCYGAGDGDQCCFTCDEVRELYRKRGWSFDPSSVAQCQQEGFLSDLEGTGDVRGCNVYGFIKVPKVAGNFQFSPARSFQQARIHVDDLLEFTQARFNTTHIINSLSFGEFRQEDFADQTVGLSNPLDGTKQVVGDEVVMHQYFPKVVPTEFVETNGKAIDSNYYSVTYHRRPLSLTSGRSLPSIVFQYDISPIRMRIKMVNRTFAQFLTSLCAIVGGVFAIMRMLDAWLDTLFSHWRKKRAEVGPPGALLG